MTLNMIEGNPTKLLIKFSIPMLIGNIFQQVYNLVDSVIVGQFVGKDALAAVGATGSLTFFFFALCNGLASGGGIITSQAFGRGDTRDVKNCIANTGYIMTVMPILVGVLAFLLTRPLLNLLETPEVIIDDACAYMQTQCIGLLFVSLYNLASSMLRALGDSRTPLVFLIFSCILNAGLDILFVYNFEMGAFGAGVATVIAQFVSGAACLIYAFKSNPYFKLDRKDIRINKSLINKTLKLGIPLSLQFSLIAISSMALQRVVNTFGEVTVAAFTATSRIEQMIHQPYQTLSAALATFCGQNYGARRNDRMITGYYKSLWIMIGFTVIMVPVMQLFGSNIMSLFVKEQEVIDMGAKALKISSAFYIFLGMIYVVRGVLNGIGDSFFALLNGVVEVIGRFVVPVVLTGIAAIGLWGIWWSVGIVWFLSGVTAWMRYVQQKKKLGNIYDKPLMLNESAEADTLQDSFDKQ